MHYHIENYFQYNGFNIIYEKQGRRRGRYSNFTPVGQNTSEIYRPHHNEIRMVVLFVVPLRDGKALPEFQVRFRNNCCHIFCLRCMCCSLVYAFPFLLLFFRKNSTLVKILREIKEDSCLFVVS